jgi:hypothetical protein
VLLCLKSTLDDYLVPTGWGFRDVLSLKRLHSSGERQVISVVSVLGSDRIAATF